MSFLDEIRACAGTELAEAAALDLAGWNCEPRPIIPFEGVRRPPVPDSEDVRRVVALPRRPQVDLSKDAEGKLNSPVAQALVAHMNGLLRRPDWQRKDCRCAALVPGRKNPCITTLLPAQAWALYEASLAGGLLALLATGSGKTAIGFLLTMVMPGCKLAAGLVPPNLVGQLVDEYLLWREHWRVPRLVYGQHKGYYEGCERGCPVLHVVPYSRISDPKHPTYLKDLNPDVVYADEMDKLANMASARTVRFVRVFADMPKTRFCGWTGTAWDKSILECAHLSAFALRGGSPLPVDMATARGWALALDPSECPAEDGALRKFCEIGEDLRAGFHRRLVETLGVVATREGAIDVPLNLLVREPPPMPAAVSDALTTVRGFKRPDGEELISALEVAKVAGEVALGFFYRWRFPLLPRNDEGKLTEESIALIKDWLAKRKAWRCDLRLRLKDREEHADSERLCEDAVLRHLAGYEGPLPTWDCDTYLPWVKVKDTVVYETVPVWVDDWLARDAAAWAQEKRGIVWVSHIAFGERVAELSGLPFHVGGPGAEARIKAEKGDRSIIASTDSHGRGRDGLQYLFNEQLFTTPPASGRLAEQWLARLHRQGQKQKHVNAEFYLHVRELRESLERAMARAEFASTTWGAEQKLLTSDCEWRE